MQKYLLQYLWVWGEYNLIFISVKAFKKRLAPRSFGRWLPQDDKVGSMCRTPSLTLKDDGTGVTLSMGSFDTSLCDGSE
jgi:hypothetical protein